MKKEPSDQITIMQYVFIINGFQVGVGVLSLPREVAEKAGTDGWMAIVLSWLVGILAGYAWIKAMEKYPELTPFELFPRLFGTVIGKIVIAGYVVYFGFYSFLIQVKSMLYIKAWLLPKTPDFVIVSLFALPTLLIVRSRVRILGRFSELIFYMTTWMLFIVLIPIKDGSVLHLLPFFKEGLSPIIQAMGVTIYSMVGFEISGFLYPYLQNKKYAVRGMIAANTLTMLTYLFVTIACFIYFSPAEVTEYNQPVLNLLKVIEFRFLERFDMVFFAVYLLVVSTAWMPVLYFCSIGSAMVFGKQNHVPFAFAGMAAIIAITLLVHPNWFHADAWQKLLSKSAIGMAYVFPVLLCGYIWIYRKAKRRGSH
ncbi:GerAB/ArcD/ProY family transporter [Paenibacillus sp. GYB003]|uniref:GerAB/ArcD/ProY family transporter n=1 Tax=Paenibacillus sp. GYB003 TaxID=2994392 RepID=UPI002F96C835